MSKVLVIFFVVLGCRGLGEPGSQETPTVDQPSDESGLKLTLDTSFATSVGHVVSLPAGGFLTTGVARAKQEDPFSGFILASDPQGKTTFRIEGSPRGSFGSLLLDSGESFMTLEFVERPDFEFLYDVDFVRFSKTGKELRRTSLHSISDNLFRSGNCFSGRKPAFADFNAISIKRMDNGDTVASIYACFQHILLRMNSEDHVVWTQEVTSALREGSMYESSLLSLDNDTSIGTVVVELKDGDVSAQIERVGASGETSAKTATLISQFDLSTGRVIQSHVISRDRDEHIRTIQKDERALILIGVKARENPSHKSTKQNDLFLRAIEVGDEPGNVPKSAWLRIYNFGNEQLPLTSLMTKEHQLLIGGCYGHVVVDTGSWMEFPDGFVAAFETNSGGFLGGTAIHTERKDVVLSMDVVDQTRIVLGGYVNAPITHTADTDKSQGYSKGLVQVLSLDAIKGGSLKSSIDSASLGERQ